MQTKINDTETGKTIHREDLKDVHDGWIERQMKNKKIEPLFNVKESSRMAGKIHSVMASICNYEVKRLYSRKGDKKYAFFYAIKGDLSGCTLRQINLVAEFLQATFQNDFASDFNHYGVVLNSTIDTKINTEHQMLYLYAELQFEEEWKPNEDFEEVTLK